MKNPYRPSEIPVVSAPITSSNLRNARNHPVINLGCCTSFQLFENTGISYDGTVCIIGNSARGIGIAKSMIRRSQKPFLFLGTVGDSNSVFSSFEPEWTSDCAQQNLPRGNGAIFFSKPYAAYLEICEYVEEWSQEYFVILHLGNGLQAGSELMNLFSAMNQCLVFCDSVPQSIRNSDTRAITPLEFMKYMRYLLVFSSGSETKELIELLPTYQYERVSNTTGFNIHSSRSIFHPFHRHRGHGTSVSQTRTMEYKKDVFEMDELQRIFSSEYMLVYNARTNSVFLAQPI